RARLIELLAALVLAATLGKRRFGGGKLRARFRVIELDQHIAFTDLLTFLETDDGDAIGHFRGDVDGLVRAHGAERFDFLRERLDLRLRDDDARGAHVASAVGRIGRRPIRVRAEPYPQPDDKRDERRDADRDAAAIHMLRHNSTERADDWEIDAAER